MPTSTYEALPSSVLAFKKSHNLGRFDPIAPEIQAQKVKDAWGEVEEKGEILTSLQALRTVYTFWSIGHIPLQKGTSRSLLPD